MNFKLCVSISGNLLWLYAVVFIVTVVNVSWISDDALITMRHVLNFINGYGINFVIYDLKRDKVIASNFIPTHGTRTQ